MVGNPVCLVLLCLISARRDKGCPQYRVRNWHATDALRPVQKLCRHVENTWAISRQFCLSKIDDDLAKLPLCPHLLPTLFVTKDYCSLCSEFHTFVTNKSYWSALSGVFTILPFAIKRLQCYWDSHSPFRVHLFEGTLTFLTNKPGQISPHNKAILLKPAFSPVTICLCIKKRLQFYTRTSVARSDFTLSKTDWHSLLTNPGHISPTSNPTEARFQSCYNLPL